MIKVQEVEPRTVFKKAYTITCHFLWIFPINFMPRKSFPQSYTSILNKLK